MLFLVLSFFLLFNYSAGAAFFLHPLDSNQWEIFGDDSFVQSWTNDDGELYARFWHTQLPEPSQIIFVMKRVVPPYTIFHNGSGVIQVISKGADGNAVHKVAHQFPVALSFDVGLLIRYDYAQKTIYHVNRDGSLSMRKLSSLNEEVHRLRFGEGGTPKDFYVYDGKMTSCVDSKCRGFQFEKNYYKISKPPLSIILIIIFILIILSVFYYFLCIKK